MTLNSLVKKVAEKEQITQKKARSMVTSVFAVITDTMAEGDQILIPAFGRFTTKNRKARFGTNLVTKEKVDIPAKRAVSFAPTSELKERVEILL